MNDTNRDENGFLVPTASGIIQTSDSCSIAWALFDRNAAEWEVDMGSPDAAEELTGWYRVDNGPGRVFCADPYVARVTGRRVLVKQVRGLDI